MGLILLLDLHKSLSVFARELTCFIDFIKEVVIDFHEFDFVIEVGAFSSAHS